MEAAAAPDPVRPPRFLRPFPSFLFRADRPLAYVFKTWLLCLLPSLALAAAIGFLAPAARQPDLPVALGAGPLLIGLVLVAPLLETLLMSGPLLLLHHLFGFGPAVVGSALLWGVAHALAAPTWGLVVWWPFLVLSISFLVWVRGGFWRAVLLVTAVHGLQNGVPGLLFWLAETLGW